MAGRGLGSLTLDLIAKIGGFVGPLSQAERELDKRTRAMDKRAQAFAKSINSAFGGMALKLGSFIGGFFAVNKAVDGFFSSIDRADQMRDLSIQLGIGVESLSSLAYAAQQTGVDLDTLATSLKFLEKNAAAALDPKSRQRGLFDAILGKGKADLQDTEHLLSQLADAFSKMEDTPTRAALELELFGKSGLKMAEFLKQGSTEIEKLRDRAKELGVTIDQGTADAADQFNDKLADLKSVAAGLGTQLAEALMPQVEHLLDWMIKFGSDPGNVEKLVNDTTAAFHNLADAISSVATFGSQIYGVLDTIQGKLIGLEKAGQGAAFAIYEAMTPDGSWADKFLQNNKARLGLTDLNGLAGGPTSRGGRRHPKGEADAAATAVDEDAAKRVAAFLGGNTDATNKNAEAKRAAAEAAREQKRREEELAEAVKKATEAQAEFDTQLEDLLNLGDPLAQNATKYRREEEELRKLWAEGSTPTAEKLAQALAALHAEREKDAEAIRKQLDPGGEHLKQMQDELDLLNLQTAAERERAQFLLDYPTASAGQADAAARIGQQIDETRHLIDNMDELRDSTADAFMAIADGSESGIDALKNLGDAFAQQLNRMSADLLSSALFGERGTTGGGLLGGIFSSVFSGFGGGNTPNFGVPGLGSGLLPGFAEGTDNAPGGWSWVGERGKELVRLPRGSQVLPHDESMAMAGGVHQENHFHLGAPTELRTQQQIAARVGFEARRANTRNGVKA